MPSRQAILPCAPSGRGSMLGFAPRVAPWALTAGPVGASCRLPRPGCSRSECHLEAEELCRSFHFWPKPQTPWPGSEVPLVRGRRLVLTRKIRHPESPGVETALFYIWRGEQHAPRAS